MCRKVAEAIATFRRGIEPEGNTELWSDLGHVYAVSGDRAEAQKVLDHLQDVSKQVYVAPCNTAVMHAGLGNTDLAFAALERAFDECSYLLVEYLNTDERLQSLKADPRFAHLRRRTRLPALD